MEQTFFLFILLQVCVGQQREFNFPSMIEALLGSCVEIPCSVTPAPTDNLKVVWNVGSNPFNPRVIYSTQQEEISARYKKRTELVTSTKDSCTLRINTVIKQDDNSYYPSEKKRFFQKSAPKTVQLKVTDLQPDSELSVPEEVLEGKATIITCSTNHTCGSTPPQFTWNISGLQVTEHNRDLGDGRWTALSELTYQPSEADDGSGIQCTVLFPNGQARHKTAKLSIKKGPQTNAYIGPVIGIIFIMAFSGLVYVIWRKKQCLRRKNIEGRLGRKLETKEVMYSKKCPGYTDLLEREKSAYYTMEPTANHHQPGKGDNYQPSSQSVDLYENISRNVNNT